MTAASTIIGIDPGTHTGVAIYDSLNGVLTEVASMPIHEAMSLVDEAQRSGRLKMVVFEDARKRGGKSSKNRLQGAGSIKRDSTIWEDYLTYLGVKYIGVKPMADSTKWDAEKFKRITGWQGRTNNHGRDAGVLIWGMR